VTRSCVFACIPVSLLTVCLSAHHGGAPAPEAQTPTAKPPPASAPASAPATQPGKKMKWSREYWPEDQGGKLKFEYEMRPNSEGKYMRNGMSRAFYANGQIEREGRYKDNQRVGKWTFYKIDGTKAKDSDYGGDVTDVPAKPATRPATPPATPPTTPPTTPPASRPATPNPPQATPRNPPPPPASRPSAR
jgi:hypothetical protein